jgi:hypothetical protein
MDRRRFLELSGLAGVGAVAAPWLTPRVAPYRAKIVDPRSKPIHVARPCLWGVHADPRGQESQQDAQLNIEKEVGRRFAVVRHYTTWRTQIPTDFQDWTQNRGSTPYVGWQAWMSNSGPYISWALIAAGRYDDWVRAQAQSIKAAAFPMYIAFHHEPEVDHQCGSAKDFRAAFNHIQSVFQHEGVTNVAWVMTLMASTYRGGHGGPGAWEPAQYDYVGVDGYNRYPCDPKGYKSFADVFEPARDFAVDRRKPLFIGEFACVEQNACGHGSGDPQGKAKWFTAGASVIKTWPEVAVVCYSHVRAKNYEYWVDSSKYSLAAYKAMGKDPYFK